jgi:hypothetical protein
MDISSRLSTSSSLLRPSTILGGSMSAAARLQCHLLLEGVQALKPVSAPLQGSIDVPSFVL